MKVIKHKLDDQSMKFLRSIVGRTSNRSAKARTNNLPIHPSSSINVGLYQHFKGNRYYVYGTARHSENEEIMVVYAPEHKHDDLWVRPLHMFEERVETEAGEVPRFAYVDMP